MNTKSLWSEDGVLSYGLFCLPTRNSRPATRGFTLVELLVVIAIIGVLVALLLPAVQAAREAARRSQCVNNLKQIGLGIQNYESSFRAMPGQTSNFQEVPGVDVSGESWMMAILPFIEQQPLFESIDPSGALADSEGMVRLENHQAIRTPVETYYCPSDNSKGQIVTDGWLVEGFEFAVTNYAGVIGPHNLGNASVFGGLPDCHNSNLNQECTGSFWRYSKGTPLKLQTYTDGLSNTIIVGEVLPEFDSFKYWALSNGTVAGTHAPINYLPEPNMPWFGWPDQWGFRSRHPGGAQFLWGDGHISLLSESINQEVYRAMSTRAGGELVSE